MMAALQVRESQYGRSERSKSQDMRRSLGDSSTEDADDRSTDDDQLGSDYADPYHSDEHDRHVAAANDAERRTEAIGTPPTETELVPIGLPQLASPPVDADCVYAFVGESKWLETQRREEVNEVNTTEIEKERNGSFSGGESVETKNDEGNGGSSEGLVSSVTQKPWHDYQPENVIKLLSGERLGWWSAQKFDKRVRMRALVQGAVNDARTRIVLDTGANISVISERFAKQHRLREVRDHGRRMEIQGFTKGTMATTKRALGKVTLGWNQVYECELWVMDHGVGVDVVLGTYVMIPAGVRLDLFHVTARLPDEVEIPLIRTQRVTDTRIEGPHVPDGPTEVFTIPGHELRDYRTANNETHGLWVQRTKELIPKVVEFRRGRPRRVRVTNISDCLVACPVHLPLLLWVPRGDLPRTEGYVRLGSDNVPYTTPTKILRRLSESSEGSVSDRDDQAECATATTEPSTEMVAEVVHQEEERPKLTAHSDMMSEGSEVTQLKLEGAYVAAAAVSEDWGDATLRMRQITPKNVVVICLCIDYKMVNSVTAILKYAMPLGDDLLTDMEKYLWYCSLDAASGFWAVMMTQRAWKISAFVFALGHFVWLRMPVGLKKAPMIYQRMIDNALWGFVQPQGGWSAFAERVRTAEAADTADGGSPTDTVTHSRTRFEADRESSDLPDPLSEVVNYPRGDMFASGEADQSSLVPVFERRSFVDDIWFGGESFDSCLETLDRLLSRFEECRFSVSFTKSMLAQSTVEFLSLAVSRDGLRADATKLKSSRS
ncbi:unnamed protein product [Phytophthora fragariaefolia]|uniref:Unnamed protein product n=1 Tax=Phytophthora fragariaefolia TaxID=1490495 RepID=A0A9W6UAU0_9STRA|nr:unnamed protein product [Phytophthora fragariaefolia]